MVWKQVKVAASNKTTKKSTTSGPKCSWSIGAAPDERQEAPNGCPRASQEGPPGSQKCYKSKWILTICGSEASQGGSKQQDQEEEHHEEGRTPRGWKCAHHVRWRRLGPHQVLRRSSCSGGQIARWQQTWGASHGRATRRFASAPVVLRRKYPGPGEAWAPGDMVVS